MCGYALVEYSLKYYHQRASVVSDALDLPGTIGEVVAFISSDFIGLDCQGNSEMYVLGYFSPGLIMVYIIKILEDTFKGTEEEDCECAGPEVVCGFESVCFLSYLGMT